MDTLKALVTSSENPENISLFIKAIATLAVLFGVDQAVVTQANNEIMSLITNGGMAISALIAIYGIGRKIKNGQWSAAQ